MRIFVLSGMIAAALLSSAPARAETWYPWCAWYDWTTYNCGFVSQQQCLATISGQRGVCRPNQFPPPPGARRGKRQSEAPSGSGPRSSSAGTARPGEPARMVQLPNGRWVSSYGCYTDEGFGRYRECGIGDHD